MKTRPTTPLWTPAGSLPTVETGAHRAPDTASLIDPSKKPASPAQGFQPPMRPAPRPLPLRPRKVRNGVKVPAGDIAPAASPTAWAAQRWLRLLEQAAPGDLLIQGLEYARLGQTKRLTLSPGSIVANVQGRAERAYTITITLPTFAQEQWDKVVSAMSEGAIYAAKLLAGELPPNIEDIFGPLSLRLFPAEPAELTVSCDCAAIAAAAQLAATNYSLGINNLANRPPQPLPLPQPEPEKPNPNGWCKHVCCVAYLIAHKLASEPFLMFALRGLEGRDLLERLRQRRTLTAAPGTSTQIYPQRVPGVSDMPFPALEEVLDSFWEPGAGLSELDLPLTPPQVSHPLLRRLGPSPFLNAQFPLVGLLASCYETISESARKTDGETPPTPVEETVAEPEVSPEGDDETPATDD